jgi:magnesium-transporting ATPase (P-type)
MSSHQAPGQQPVTRADNRSYDEYDEPRGFGWVVFSGVMIMIAGVLNFVYGIAAIAESQFYVANTHFIFSDLKTWGWIVMLVGVLQVAVAAGVWAQAQWARWTGVFIAGLSAIAQLMFIAAFPFLSVAVFTLDILVIYGLICYGGRLEEG